MPEKAILRIVIAAMIPLVALPSFLGTGSEVYQHLAAGGSAAGMPAKIAAAMLCGALVFVASILVARAVRAIWREADPGPVRYDSNAPAQSSWIGPDPADRTPGPPVAAPDLRKTLARFRGVVFAVAAVIAGCAVYGFSTVIWSDGGARTFEAWQSAALLVGLFVLALPFAALGAFALVATALLAWICFAVVRGALRD